MQFPFIILFVMVLLANLFWVFLSRAAQVEERVFVENRRRARRELR